MHIYKENKSDDLFSYRVFIRILMDKTIADKLMIHKITPSIDKWLKRLYTQLIESTNQSLIKVLKVVKPTFMKMTAKNFDK